MATPFSAVDLEGTGALAFPFFKKEPSFPDPRTVNPNVGLEDLFRRSKELLGDPTETGAQASRASQIAAGGGGPTGVGAGAGAAPGAAPGTLQAPPAFEQPQLGGGGDGGFPGFPGGVGGGGGTDWLKLLGGGADVLKSLRDLFGRRQPAQGPGLEGPAMTPPVDVPLSDFERSIFEKMFSDPNAVPIDAFGAGIEPGVTAGTGPSFWSGLASRLSSAAPYIGGAVAGAKDLFDIFSNRRDPRSDIRKASDTAIDVAAGALAPATFGASELAAPIIKGKLGRVESGHPLAAAPIFGESLADFAGGNTARGAFGAAFPIVGGSIYDIFNKPGSYEKFGGELGKTLTLEDQQTRQLANAITSARSPQEIDQALLAFRGAIGSRVGGYGGTIQRNLSDITMPTSHPSWLPLPQYPGLYADPMGGNLIMGPGDNFQALGSFPDPYLSTIQQDIANYQSNPSAYTLADPNYDRAMAGWQAGRRGTLPALSTYGPNPEAYNAALIPDLPGATGTAHEWGQTADFAPMTAALRSLLDQRLRQFYGGA